MTWLRPATFALLASGLFVSASCGSSGEPGNEGGASASGGSAAGGASSSTGGTAGSGGSQQGGFSGTSGASSGGQANGGEPSSSGAPGSGGKSSGGATSSGGKASSGGKSSAGGPSSGGKAASGGTSSGGKAASGGSETGGVTGGLVCGSKICPNNQVCCNASCSRCAAPDMVCDQRACEPGTGGSGSGSCSSAADCRLFDDYCDGCACRVLTKPDPDPKCSGMTVACIVAPCANKVADCVGGRCVAVAEK